MSHMMILWARESQSKTGKAVNFKNSRQTVLSLTSRLSVLTEIGKLFHMAGPPIKKEWAVEASEWRGICKTILSFRFIGLRELTILSMKQQILYELSLLRGKPKHFSECSKIGSPREISKRNLAQEFMTIRNLLTGPIADFEKIWSAF
jgi:hypothetical protein